MGDEEDRRKNARDRKRKQRNGKSEKQKEESRKRARSRMRKRRRKPSESQSSEHPRRNRKRSPSNDFFSDSDHERDERRQQHNAIANLARDQARENETHQQQRQRRQQETAQTRSRRFGGLERAAIFSLQDLNEEDVPENYLGPMTATCEYCRAKHFEAERPPDRKFTHCCQKGKVYIEPSEEFPTYIKNLYTSGDRKSENFLNHSRKYNNAFSLASFGTTVVKLSPGPRQFKIQGLTYHKVSGAHPSENQERRFSQVYFLDPEEALNNRFGNPAHQGCLREVLRKIDSLLRQKNPYVRSYITMYEVEKAANEEATAQNIPVKAVFMDFTTDKTTDRRRYNAPTTTTEIAIIFQMNDDGEPPSKRDLRIYPRGDRFQQLHILSPLTDPMTYPLFFFYGENGWSESLRQVIPSTIRSLQTFTTKRVSQLQFYSYKMAIRDNEFNPLLYGRRLFQQFVCDEFMKVEGNRLNYIKQHQNELMAASYSGLVDHVRNIANGNNSRIGRMVILPSSFTGSPRHMQQLYQDGMSVVAKFGKPDLFITFTCNKNWREITENLLPGQIPEDRPDLICRVFRLKLKSLLADIKDLHVLGKATAWMYSIEFQKRGLPHAHILIILAANSKIRTTDDIDKIVSAEIPSSRRFPRLHKIVTKFMVHQPCGAVNGNPDAPCLNDQGECTKKFGPQGKPYVENTTTNKDGYPEYRRRRPPNNYIMMPKKSGRGHVKVDCRFVVPFNAYLLLKYNAHINVEICSSVRSIKYIYKYIYKGPDAATIRIHHGEDRARTVDHDEVADYLNCRYLSSIEAMWRFLEFPLHEQSHHIIRLAVHLENEQQITFVPGQEERAINRHETTLTAWFNLNRLHPEARNLRYTDIPQHYVFNNSTKSWQPRQRGGDQVISRMYSVSPADIQRFSLRLLLLQTPGATSFKYLRTVDGVVHATFQEAAKARGLLQDEMQYGQWLREASQDQMGKALRIMFSFILIYLSPSNSRTLWEEFKEHLSEDFSRIPQFAALKYDYALKDIQQILDQHQKSLSDYSLPLPVPNLTSPTLTSSNRQTETEAANRNQAVFNEQQSEIYNTIMHSIEDTNPNSAKCYFIDAPGGCGKTFLLNTIIHRIRGQGKKIGVAASTGIAATLFDKGTTAHSLFGIPLKVNNNSTANITLGTEKCRFLEECVAFIWDEATMPPVHAIMCVDRLLRFLKQRPHVPFGGVVFIFSGDYRQTLPVVPRGGKSKILEACLKGSSLWQHFNILRLSRNMRAAAGQTEFAKFVLGIGDGRVPLQTDLGNDLIEIPPSYISTGDIVEETFGDTLRTGNISEMSKRVILCSKNQPALEMNEVIQQQIPGVSKVYYSVDSVATDVQMEENVAYPTEFLNSLTPSGMPPHKLELKVGSIIMLLRNLSFAEGLCNGSRLIVEKLLDNYIIARKLKDGPRRPDDIVVVPRISLEPSDLALPFKLRRLQFPVRVAFAMTINKSQGQTYDTVGIYLPEPVFAHGQLYVAVSRAKMASGVKLKIFTTSNQGKLKPRSNKVFTKNIVYKELLN